jgi:hypothetical protein
MISCKLCGHEFDESKEELLDCTCGCGGDKVLCPNCGYEVRLPNSNMGRRVKKQEEMGFFGKVMKIFRMDSY